MNTKLSATQTTVLNAAADRVDGNIEPLPSKLRGGARTSVIDGLLAKGLVIRDGDNYLLTEVGYSAVDRQVPAPKDVGNNDTLDAPQNIDAFSVPVRAGTKQATMIAMLKRPDGATVKQIMETTGWLAGPYGTRHALWCDQEKTRTECCIGEMCRRATDLSNRVMASLLVTPSPSQRV